MQETSSEVVANQVHLISVDRAAGEFKYWVPTDLVAKFVVLSNLCCEEEFGLEMGSCDEVSPLTVHTLYDDEIDGWQTPENGFKELRKCEDLYDSWLRVAS